MSEGAITQAYLQAILHYDSETGDFTWLPRNPDRKGWNKRRAGTIAGTINVHGYRVINLMDVPRTAHRLAFIWMGEEAPKMVDHADGDRANNRWSNLRRANNSLNLANAGMRSDNLSGVKGVCWDSRRGKWLVHLQRDKRTFHVGYFDNLDAAAVAYEKAAAAHFGEFHRAVRLPV